MPSNGFLADGADTSRANPGPLGHDRFRRCGQVENKRPVVATQPCLAPLRTVMAELTGPQAGTPSAWHGRDRYLKGTVTGPGTGW